MACGLLCVCGGVPMWVFGGFPCRSPWWFVGLFCGRWGLWGGVGGVVFFVGGVAEWVLVVGVRVGAEFVSVWGLGCGG